MAMALTEANGGRVLEVTVSGTLAHEEYQQQFIPALERLLQQHGNVNLLFEMTNFHGWQAHAAWDDLKMSVKHISHIPRVAMVGDRQWEKTLTALWKPFTQSEVRYFDRAQAAEARAWVEGMG